MRKRRAISWLLALSLLLGTCPMLAATAAAADPTNLTSWTDDGLKRYGQSEDAPATPSQKISLEAARNEYERGQIVVRSDAQDFEVTSVEFTALQNADGETIGAENLHYHFALYEVNIPTDHCGIDWQPSMQGVPLYAKDQLCDALSNERSISVAKGCNQPIYLEVFVPAGTQPGLYEGQVTVKTSLGDIQKELIVQVFDATVPEMKDAKFTYFNWMTDIAQGYYTEWNAFTTYYGIQDVNKEHTDFTPALYEILNNWAEIAVSHRQNMVMISTTALLDAANSKVDAEGSYTFDWTLFDKYVDVWLKHGITRLAGIHFGYHEKDVMLKDDGKGNAAFAWEPYSKNLGYHMDKDNWYRQYLPALAEHLKAYDITKYAQFTGTDKKCLYDIWCQHLYDEPSNMKLWNYYCDLSKKYLGQEIDVFDADASGVSHDSNVAKKMDILVPDEYLVPGYETYYHNFADQGQEFWTYVCIGPAKPWLNRFVHQPDTTYPVLFWYNAQVDATGYLHWGWNVWNVGPFADGDSYMVYPDVKNKTLLGSIRFDGQRDGVEDWELAQLARKTSAEVTQQLLDLAVEHPNGKYVQNIQEFRALRHGLLELASGTIPDTLPEISEPDNGLPKLPDNAYFVDNTDSQIKYSDMEEYQGGSGYMGSVHYNNCKGAVGTDGGSASFTFTGSGVGVMGEKGFNAGNLRVDLYNAENKLIDSKIVNCNASQIEPYFISYQKTDLPYGTYTIKVTNVRTEVPGKDNSQMVLDAFIVYDDAYAENHVTVKKIQNTKGKIILKADGKELNSGARVEKGTQIEITTEPISGLYCRYLDVSGQIIKAPCTITANQDLVISAEFKPAENVPVPENVALKKTVTASSTDTDSGYTLDGAVDGQHGDEGGSEATAWSNKAEAQNQHHLEENVWVCVDLGQTYTIDRAVLTWSNWENVVPDTYMVQVSDRADGPFRDVFTQNGKETGPSSFSHEFAPETAQFVRVFIPKEGNEAMGWHAVRLNELEVYEHTEPVEQNKTALKEQIKAAEALAEADYAADSWAAMEKALREAQIVDVDAYATQDEIDAAAAALADAVKALVPKEEKPVEPDVKPDVKPDWRPVHPVQPEKPEDNRFTDIRPNDYYYDAVNWSAENGITTGIDSLHFAPDLVCTRAQAVTFLWRATGSPEPANRENPFTDVKDTDYFCKAVLWAVEEGITTGTSETTFSPDMMCSRAHIVTFLWRAKRMPLASGTNPFADVKPDDYFCNAVQWAVDETITTGTSNTTFSPDAPCTRAQIVTFLYRTYVD